MSPTPLRQHATSSAHLEDIFAAVQASMDGMAVLDRNGVFTYMNDSHARKYGYDSADELLGRTWQTLYRGEELARFQNQIMPKFYRDGSWRGDAVGTRKNGSTFPQQVSLNRYGDGGLICVMRDVTHEKQAELERAELLAREHAARLKAEAARERSAFLAEASAALDASLDFESTLRTVVEHAAPRLAHGCELTVIGPDGTTRPGARAYQNCAAPAELRGHSCAELRGHSYNDTISLCVPLRTRGRALGALNLTGVRADLPDELALIEDYANRAALAMDNALLYQEAQNAIRTRHEFISLASHELKTPLTSLQGYVQLLTRAICRKTPQAMSQETILGILDGSEQQCKRMVRFIDTLLDVSRISGGKLRLEFECFDLCELVSEVAARLSIDLALPPERLLLELPVPVVGTWDRLRLEQIITNLITNGLKYGRGAPVTIAVTDRKPGARLVVRDSGIGIAPEYLRKIFAPFERAVSSRSFQGAGLGLWIVRQLVEAHCGSINVESRVGEGSTFTVDLPTEHMLHLK